MASYGELLREARHRRGITQKQLGQLAGLSNSVICHYEADRQRASLSATLRMAQALETDPLPLLRTRRPLPPALEALTAEQWVALREWLGTL